MQELIQEHKNEIRATLKSWDNSVKIKGKASLVSILDAMDLDTSISVEGVNKKFSIWYNLAMLNTRSRNKSLYNYLTDKHTIRQFLVQFVFISLFFNFCFQGVRIFMK